MSPKRILEIACFNIESALIAQDTGAQRIEFCVDYQGGGISPPKELLLEARNKIKIPMYVIIRPRTGDFIYSEMEIQWMIQYILFCGLNGIDGIVFGALTKENAIDLGTCSRLLEAAGAMSLTFHRGIDACSDVENSISRLINLGVHRVLTSGGQKDALSGREQIKQLQLKFGKKIIIMPGGGVRSGNIGLLMDTGCREFHSSAILHGDKTDAKEIKMLKEFL